MIDPAKATTNRVRAVAVTAMRQDMLLQARVILASSLKGE